MNLQTRIDLAAKLGEYILSDQPEWQAVKTRAGLTNPWFTPEFVDLASKNIATHFLNKQELIKWSTNYNCEPARSKIVGIVMAGNIPLVGFHDLICVFITGHYAMIKPSSKDEVLVKHLVNKMIGWEGEAEQYLVISQMIKNCDAYIATGSNNSSRYFEYYFQKYPSIIRKNRTSVAILTGEEAADELEKLADDVYQFFGLGCRNVTKIFVPKDYDFIPLLNAFKKYDHLIDHNKYKNNYDYNLAMHILNNKYYMTNGSILLVEEASPFSPISQLHYEYYTNEKEVRNSLKNNQDIQCIVGKNDIAFGGAQCPGICDYADGVDTVQFLMNLN